MDISSYSEVDTHNRIDAFIETLESLRAGGWPKSRVTSP